MGEVVNSSVFDSDLANISKSQKNKALAALLAVTLVWGATFIWMKQALDALDVEKTIYGINGVVAVLVFARFAIAAIMMIVFFKKKQEILLATLRSGKMA